MWLKTDGVLALFVNVTPTWPINVQTKSELGHTGLEAEMNSYLLYLWQDGLPSGHKDAFLQRGHIAG